MQFTIVYVAIMSVLYPTIVFPDEGDTLDCIPVVMAGYDVVAYFDLSSGSCGSVEGIEDYSYNLASNDANGIARYYQFWFSSEDNLNKFSTNPWKYAPRFGGFCSYGTCCETSEDGWPWSSTHLGPPAGPDPDNCGFRVYNNRLYFNIWNDYDKRFFGSAESHISAGEERWISWFGNLTAGPFNWDCFSTSGWDYMDCVDDGQEKAPTVDYVNNNGLVSCGVNPSGKPWILIICCSIGALVILCLCCCFGYRYYRNKSKIKLKKQFEMLEDDNHTINTQDFDINTTDTENMNTTGVDTVDISNENRENLINIENEGGD